MAHAVVLDRYGDADVLEVRDVPLPEPGPGQVRLRVRAASVNPIDTKVRSGTYSGGTPLAEPIVLGSDVAGEVDAVGPGVTELQPGAEVLGSARGGAYADYALADVAAVTAKPAGMGWPVAASIDIAGRTAYRVLRQLDVQAGQTILVHGASGAVGRFAVQLATMWGLTVIGTAGASRLDDLRSLGVVAVTYGDGWEDRVGAVAPGQVDAVFDAAGKGMLEGSLRLAKRADRVITIADPDAGSLGVEFSSGLGDAGVGMTESLEVVTRAVADGQVDVAIAATFPLTQVADAHRLSESGHAGGKVVLLPGQSLPGRHEPAEASA